MNAIRTEENSLDKTRIASKETTASVVWAALAIQLALGVGLLWAAARSLKAYDKEVQERTRELAEAKALTELIVQSISDGIIIADPDGHLTYLNKAAGDLYGDLRPNTLHEAPELHRLYDMGGKTPLTEEQLPLTRALSGESVDDFEMIYELPGGAGQLVASVAARPFRKADGTINGAVAAVRDISG